MKKGIIIATALVGIAGGVAIGQTVLFGSAQNEEFLTASEAKKIALQQFNGTVIEYDFDSEDYTPHYEFEIKNDTEKVEIEVDAINGNAVITERESLIVQSKIEKAEDALEHQIGQVEAQAAIAKDTAQQEVINKMKPATSEKTASGTQTATQTQQAASANNPDQVVEQTTQSIISKSQAIAIAQAKATGTVTKAKLDYEQGIQVYEIEIKNGNTEYDFDINAITGDILEFDTDYDND